MWIAHKAKQGDTLKTIAKQYKNKDPNAILKYAKNKKIARDLQSGKPIKAGTTVWVLDPKGKCYVIRKNGKQVVLTEKEYRKFQKDVDKKMMEVLERQRRHYNYAVDAHDAQLKINKEQWFVSSIVSTFSSVPEPKWQSARASYDKLRKVVSGKKYGEFADAAADCEFEVTKYTNDVNNWVGGLISTAQASLPVLKAVAETGKFCGVLAAVTIAAPASLGAAVLVGSASNTGVGLLYDGSESASLAANGFKPLPAGEIGKRMLSNALTGAGGAYMTGKLIKLVQGPFIKLICSNAFIKKQAIRMAHKVIPKSVLDKQVNAVLTSKQGQAMIAEASKRGTVHIQTVKDLIGQDTIVIEALTKFMMRAGSGAFTKQFGAGKFVHDYLLSWIKTSPNDLVAKETQIAKAAAKQLANSDVADQIFDKVVKDNMRDFEAALAEIMTKHAEKAIVKALR